MEEDIKVDDITLNPVQEFTFLASIIARDGHNNKDMDGVQEVCEEATRFHA